MPTNTPTTSDRVEKAPSLPGLLAAMSVLASEGEPKNGAKLSPCRNYRYALWRVVGDSPRPFVVIGLNPSTADETEDNPTIRRCAGFACRESCGVLVMINLFAYRTTSPSNMTRVFDPIGPANNDALAWYTKLPEPMPQPLVVAAWGAHGAYLDRGVVVQKLLADAGVQLHCFGTTKDGHPKHPLYLRADTPLQVFRTPVPKEVSNGS